MIEKPEESLTIADVIGAAAFIIFVFFAVATVLVVIAKYMAWLADKIG